MRHLRPHPVSREAGSAYIAALLVLVLLTIFGMSLVLITSTERQIGTNQRTVSRMFYNADSGAAIAISAMLNNADLTSKTIVFSQTGQVGNEITEEVETSKVSVVSTDHCNLCQINQGQQFFKVNHSFTSTARRRRPYDPLVYDTEEKRRRLPTLAQKQMSMMVEVQPWESAAEDVYSEEEGITYP